MVDHSKETKAHGFAENLFEFTANLEFLGLLGENKQIAGQYKSILFNPSEQREVYQTTVVESTFKSAEFKVMETSEIQIGGPSKQMYIMEHDTTPFWGKFKISKITPMILY